MQSITDGNFAAPASAGARTAAASPHANQGPSEPPLPARFLEPAGFAWGSFIAPDGARLRWGHLAVAAPLAECVLVGGFSECVEKYFETTVDLAARGLSVWCLGWRGQGGSERPKRFPSRPRARRYDRDATELALFTRTLPPARRLRLLIAHSMGRADRARVSAPIAQLI